MRADRRRLVAGTPARLRLGDRTLGVMPLYHTMGDPLVRCTSRRVLLPTGAGPSRGAEADRGRADHVSVPRPDALPHLVFHPDSAGATLRPSRHSVCGRRDDVDALPPLRRLRARVFLNHYGSTEIYIFTIGRDQLGKPGCAGAPSGRRTRGSVLRPATERSHAPASDEAFRVLEPPRCRCQGDPRRLVRHRRLGISTRTATWVDGGSTTRSSRGEKSTRSRVEDVLAAPRACRGGGDRRPDERWASESRRSPRGRSPVRSSTRTASRRPLARFKRRASTVTSTRSRRALRGRSCGASCEEEGDG